MHLVTRIYAPPTTKGKKGKRGTHSVGVMQMSARSASMSSLGSFASAVASLSGEPGYIQGVSVLCGRDRVGLMRKTPVGVFLAM